MRGDRLRTAQRQAARAKWSLAMEPARLTEAGACSAGIGIAVRSHIGHSEVPGLSPLQCLETRVKITHLGAVCAGGLFLISAYFWRSEGASERNLALLQGIAQQIRRLHGPWIMAADFNLPPAVLRKTGWLQLVNGQVHATGQPTCKGMEDD